MHTTMVPDQVKIMKIQAGVQVSRLGELGRHLQHWKCLGRLSFVVIILDRNIAYLVKSETPKSPHTIASPIPLPDSTPPMRHAEDSADSDTSDVRSTPSDSTAPLSPDHPLTHASPTFFLILHRIARMVVRLPPMMSPGLYASIAKVPAMSSYKSSPSSSPTDLPLRKRYQGMSELVKDDDKEEEDEEEEDKEVEESSDSDSESEDAKDEGLTTKDKDPAIGDKGLAAGDKGPGMKVESLGLGGDAAVPEGQQYAAPVVETTVGEPLGLGYGALRHREIALGEGRLPSVFIVGQSSRSVPEPERPERVSALRKPVLTTWINQEDGIAYIDVPAYPLPVPPVQTPPSHKWSSGSLLVSPAPSIVPLPISSPMIPLTVPSPIVSPATTETKGFLTKSLHHKQEKVVVTFGAIWRPILALESWAGQTDAQRAALWHAISDTQRENREL
ncbi:hypothetical protein Tco_0743072 [Tanacetum coccineum]